MDKETKNMFDEVLRTVKTGFDEVTSRLSNVETDVSGIKTEMSSVNTRLDTIESTMVTKDYLDEKMSDLRGDMVVMIRKEDTKVTWLGNMMKKKKVISDKEYKEFEKLEPFARS